MKRIVQVVYVLFVQRIVVISMKAQMSFFAKVLFIVATSIAFVLAGIYVNSFRKSTIEEREISDFKMETMNILQKLINNKNCLAFELNGTPQKGIIDINKLNLFVSKYNETEPKPAKALGFDYNIKIAQFPKNYNLYPGGIKIRKEAPANVLGVHKHEAPKLELAYIKCNFDPQEKGVCRTQKDGLCCYCKSGDFDGMGWGGMSNTPICDESCLPNPAEKCPATSCSDICCYYWRCPIDACNGSKIHPCTLAGDHGYCVFAFDCNVSKCKKCDDIWCYQGHCTMIKSYKYIRKKTTTNISIPIETWSFGISSFSPEKAKYREIQLSLPVSIRYNDTFSAEGIVYIHAVKGELEELYSLIDDLCEKARANPDEEISFFKEMHFSFPVYYSDGKLCMLDSCKRVECPYTLNFENIKEEGDYVIRFSYSSGEIKVRK